MIYLGQVFDLKNDNFHDVNLLIAALKTQFYENIPGWVDILNTVLELR